MRIIDQPVPERRGEVWTPDGLVLMKPYQIVISVSVAAKQTLELPEGTPRLPVILDTGFNHNFAIRRTQLSGWAKLRPAYLRDVRIGDDQLALHAADIWLHPTGGGPPIRLDLEEGIAVYPDDVRNPARLPILGLRALVKNDLKIIIDGKRRRVKLNTKGWF